MTDDARAKALKLCREWWAQRHAEPTQRTEGAHVYDGCISDLAQAFGITWAEVGRKEEADG